MIINLYESPSLVTRVAQWQFDEWGWLTQGQTLHSYMQTLQGHLFNDPIPATFVAFRDDFAVGAVSLVTCDLQEHAALTPWLTNLFVEPGSRGKGIGAALVAHAEQAAFAAGYDAAFLHTGNALGYFLDREWEPIHTMNRNGGQEVIMERDLTVHDESETQEEAQ